MTISWGRFVASNTVSPLVGNDSWRCPAHAAKFGCRGNFAVASSCSETAPEPAERCGCALAMLFQGTAAGCGCGFGPMTNLELDVPQFRGVDPQVFISIFFVQESEVLAHQRQFGFQRRPIVVHSAYSRISRAPQDPIGAEGLKNFKLPNALTRPKIRFLNNFGRRRRKFSRNLHVVDIFSSIT